MWTSTWSAVLGTSNNPYNSWVLHTSTALKFLRLPCLLAVLALALATPDAFAQKKVLRMAFRTAVKRRHAHFIGPRRDAVCVSAICPARGLVILHLHFTGMPYVPLQATGW